MTEYFCFEIFDRKGAPIVLVASEEPLSELQMTKLMDLFEGKHNSESCYKITPCE